MLGSVAIIEVQHAFVLVHPRVVDKSADVAIEPVGVRAVRHASLKSRMKRTAAPMRVLIAFDISR